MNEIEEIRSTIITQVLGFEDSAEKSTDAELIILAS